MTTLQVKQAETRRRPPRLTVRNPKFGENRQIVAERSTARTGFCACGCGQTPRQEYSLYVHGHNNSSRKPRWIVDTDTGCWNWQLSLSSDGYGITKHRGRRVQGHRLVWESHRGMIPPGLELDHLCRNRRCVNPDHLEPVTQIENTRRRPDRKLSLAKAAAIRRIRAEQQMSYTALAGMFGVNPRTIRKVVIGESWA